MTAGGLPRPVANTSHIALYIHLIYIIYFVASHGPRYDFTHILSHAALYPCCVRFHRHWLNDSPGLHFRRLDWQYCGGLTGVGVAAVSLQVVHWTKRLSDGLIQIRSHHAVLCVEP